jgi:ornithine cyclodeaminase
MRTIDRDTVASLITMADAISAMRHGFEALARKDVVAPGEFAMSHPDSGDIHVKGAHLIGSRWLAVKVASAGFAVPGNHGCILVIGADNGQVEVLIDDDGWLTEVRTAAAAALTCDLLARPDAHIVAVVGAGAQAGFQIDALRSIRPLDDVRVAARDNAKLRDFTARHEARPCSSLDAALSDAGIVLCATTSRVPVLERVEQLAGGAHVTATGADMAGKRELGADLVRAADLVVVDDVDLARRAGILQDAPERRVATVGELLSGAAPARTSSEQITLAGLSGLGVQDAAIVELVMQRWLS